ncbi:MAG: transporter substrate-binding domain-containing protein [Planctomycetota bacterium]
MRGPLLLCLALLVGCSDRPTLETVLERGILIVGTEPEFPPFESKNEKGEIVGFDMDMARELAKDLGVKLQIEGMPFETLPTALRGGQIDLIVSGMTKNDERARTVSFSDTYYETILCLLVHTGSGIEKPADADGKRIAVKTGTTGADVAQDKFKKATLIPFPTEGACALEVATGRADAFLYDRHSILRHHKNTPDTTRVIDERLSAEPYAMACRLGDKEFVERMNAFLRAFQADGRYARLYEQYFGEPPPAR